MHGLPLGTERLRQRAPRAPQAPRPPAVVIGAGKKKKEHGTKAPIPAKADDQTNTVAHPAVRRRKEHGADAVAYAHHAAAGLCVLESAHKEKAPDNVLGVRGPHAKAFHPFEIGNENKKTRHREVPGKDHELSVILTGE